MTRPLPSLDRPAIDVAPDLLGCLLSCGDRVGRIVEVEAYGADDDPASHAHRGPTARNRAMFGPAGYLYVYLIYGVHLCANVVCGPEGTGGAVLVRALSPIGEVDDMWTRRPAARKRSDLCSGPGKLTAALGIAKVDDGCSLLESSSSVRLQPRPRDEGTFQVAVGPRIGLTKAVDRPWRFAVGGDPNVSRPRPTADFLR